MNLVSTEFETSSGRRELPVHMTEVSVRANEPGRTAVPAFFRTRCVIWWSKPPDSNEIAVSTGFQTLFVRRAQPVQAT